VITFFLAPIHLLHMPADPAEAHFQIPGDLGLFDSGVEHGGDFLAELLAAGGREEDAEFLGEGLAGFEEAAADYLAPHPGLEMQAGGAGG